MLHSKIDIGKTTVRQLVYSCCGDGSIRICYEWRLVGRVNERETMDEQFIWRGDAPHVLMWSDKSREVFRITQEGEIVRDGEVHE